MSNQASEYLKRTCLICGCHTDQTINIYEPRSGPNIVQLIQAKFKFQPLNEDKYLCYSCNNWLINWHSLQVLNSNEAEGSSSGTFRPQMNSVVQEKKYTSAAADQAQQSPQPEPPRLRPVAQVRPRQLLVDDAIGGEDNQNIGISAPTQSLAYSKRHFRYRLRPKARGRLELRSMQNCCVCDRALVVIVRSQTNLKVPAMRRKLLRQTNVAKCRKCREIAKWRTMYMQSVAKAERLEHLQGKKKPPAKPKKSLVMGRDGRRDNETRSQSNTKEETLNAPHQQKQIQQNFTSTSNNKSNHQSQQHRWQRPLIDGKIVSMLRRLGTTLSRESDAERNVSCGIGDLDRPQVKLPPIMSPYKERPRWSRPLEDDEILLDFETAISEVLPTLNGSRRPHNRATRRKLTYRMSTDEYESAVNENVIVLSDDDNNEIVEEENRERPLVLPLPRGLSVTLI